LLAGDWLGNDTYALFYRIGMNLDPENKVKIEAQPTYWKFGNKTNFQMSFCISAQVTSNLAVRLGYSYDSNPEDNRVMLQLYYYRPIL
jgi:opacity protein-like surface antigen